jgi:hypothetical protein
MRNEFSRVFFLIKTLFIVYCASLIFCTSAWANTPNACNPPCTSFGYDPRLSEWLVEYLNTITDNTPLEEVIDAILAYRTALQEQGCFMPAISDLMSYFQQSLESKGISIPEEEIEFLRDAFIKRENRLSLNYDPYHIYAKHDKHHKKKDKKKKNDHWEFSFTKKSIFGLVKFIGGTLTCLIPNPAAAAVGAGLIINGIEDIINDSRDRSTDQSAEENKRLQKALEAVGCP